MFRWDFAEAIFSRWAIKRVCKFLLKKKLGDFILGDIDLDQLEVQLSRGTIQLFDLAVNVDYINQKLVGAAVVLKEGSIASLSIKIPWKLQNCQIELEELELVLAPFMGNKNQASNSCSESSSGDKQQTSLGPDKNEPETTHESPISGSLDIHEGVKTIAKVVKWLLTSFHVRLKNLIVAFDPCLELSGNRLPVNKSLVLRIRETEFGTRLSEGVDGALVSKPDSLLGMSKLTNFVKFEGAVIEIVEMTGVDQSSETLCNDCSSNSLLLGSTTTILTGLSAGISGRMNISIPWKNGSLDIRKVDANISFDPIKMKLHPNTIEWIIIIWESLKYAGTVARTCVHFNKIDSSCSNSRLHGYSSLRNSSIQDGDVAKECMRKLSEELHSDIKGETFSEDRFPRTQVIQDWVPLSFKEDQMELEQDYGASIEQFLECFDGLRSSQANSESSGLWNWTCSVFSAINVASNLASGSNHLVAEQHIETSLRATVAGVSLLLYFHDNKENIYDHLIPPTSTQNPSLNGQSFDSFATCFSSANFDLSAFAEPNLTGHKIHHLEAKCQDVAINFQIGSRTKDCRVSVKHVKIDECYDHSSHFRMLPFAHTCNLCDQMLLNNTLKQEILALLSPCPVFVQEYDSETSCEHNAEKLGENSSSQEQMIKVELVKSFGECTFHCVVSMTDSDECLASLTSFSLHFPPCIMWIDFHLIDSLMNLFERVETCFKRERENRDIAFDDLSFLPEEAKSKDPSINMLLTRDNVHGSFVFAHTRIIICFPLQNLDDFKHLYLMDKFVILEHSPLLVAEEVLPASSLQSGSSYAPTITLNFEVGIFDLHLTDSMSKDATVDRNEPFPAKTVSAMKVLSLTCIMGNKNSGISLICQKGPATGPWMASRAWSIASTHDRRSRNNVAGKGGEFSSVAAVDDFEEISSDIHREMILSSENLLHLRFSSIRLDLHSHDYKQLNCLFNIVRHGLSNKSSSEFDASEEYPLRKNNISQTTIIVDCSILDLCIVFDEVPDCSLLIQKELVGSWNRFRLIVENFNIMSVSNIGGISGTNFFRLVHGEGKLCGSLVNDDDSISITKQDVLLISCMNSASRRGCGDGANVLSFGSAGTTITYLCNSQLSCCYTSILVHCGTIVAPGGRLDWISSIRMFFCLPFQNDFSGGDVKKADPSSNCANYEASLFFDLVDVAISYEPYFEHSDINGDETFFECDDSFELNQGISERFVGCLLAAASFSLSNYNISNSETSDYNIQLQDLGLLICESSGLKDHGSYDVSYLRKAGYAKVASWSLLAAVLRTRGLQWEVECSNSHINFDTCRDTTIGLFRLIAQLQQLYAPDIEDSLAHLQSRWNSVQHSQNTNVSNETSDNSNRLPCSDAGKKFRNCEDNSISIGLLDEIIENAFNANQKSDNPTNPYVITGDNYNDCLNTNLGISCVEGNTFEKMFCNIQLQNSRSKSNSRLSDIEIMSNKKDFLPQLIENNYFSEITAPSLTRKGCLSPEEDKKSKYDSLSRADVDCGKGRWYKNGSLMIVDNHIPNSILFDSDEHHEKTKLISVDLDSPARSSEKGKILLKNIDVRWSMFAGLDWSKEMKKLTGKDASSFFEVILSGLNVHCTIYPDGEVNVSKLSINVQDFYLFDRSANAPWKTVIGHYNSKNHLRESNAKVFKLDLETVRPDPFTPLEDYRLNIEFLPIRLHLDQSQINFFISFFRDGSSVEESSGRSKDVGRPSMADISSKPFGSLPIAEEALLPFFQKCIVKPLSVRVDYIPRQMDLASLSNGNYAELLNLVAWKGIELQLKQVCAVGVYGWASVCETVVGLWLEDISHNQVHKLLKGLAPVRSLVSVAAGTSKLVTLPIKSYKRDKKLLKGIQRGAIAFVKSISLEAVGLGVHLASGAHEMLLQAEFILRNIPSDASSSPSKMDRIKKYAKSNQPEDAQEGIRQAYQSLSDGFSRTASAIFGNPIKEFRRGGGAGSALATAVRAAPAAAIAPVTATAHAMHCTLLGMRNSMDPEHKKESMNKYLGPSRS